MSIKRKGKMTREVNFHQNIKLRVTERIVQLNLIIVKFLQLKYNPAVNTVLIKLKRILNKEELRVFPQNRVIFKQHNQHLRKQMVSLKHFRDKKLKKDNYP